MGRVKPNHRRPPRGKGAPAYYAPPRHSGVTGAAAVEFMARGSDPPGVTSARYHSTKRLFRGIVILLKHHASETNCNRQASTYGFVVSDMY
jgi:hypothetical protein